MSERMNPPASAIVSTRRQVMVGAAIAFGGLALSTKLRAAQQAQMAEVPEDPAHKMLTSLHQEADMKGSAQRVYEALLDTKQFAAFSNMPADIHGEAGGAFKMFSGMIVGRNVELVPNQRIVQAWRAGHWDAGIYSIVKFEFKESGGQTHVVLDHTGFPAGEYDHLSSGWQSHYLQPLMKYLA